MEEKILLKANAKINLFLKILRRRSDGFHDIESIMAPVELHDLIEMRRTEDGLYLECIDLEEPLPQEKNIAYRAAALFLKEFDVPGGVGIRLKKNVPSGAGLGGGSSDAASVLTGMDRLYPGRSGQEDLLRLAAMLGSDVPFFIINKPALISGRGEKIQIIDKPLPATWVVLIKPVFGVPTGWAYSAYDEHEKMNPCRLTEPIDSVSHIGSLTARNFGPEVLFNSFEKCVFAAYPELGGIKSSILKTGAEGAMMSGSGSTVFGLFDSREKAELSAAGLSTENPRWKVFVTRLL